MADSDTDNFIAQPEYASPQPRTRHSQVVSLAPLNGKTFDAVGAKLVAGNDFPKGDKGVTCGPAVGCAWQQPAKP